MKKIFAISALALAAAVSLNAKTADELRIYINPGHGSWTPNDRPATLVGHGAYSRTNTDTLSFFESNTNLRKGFAVLETLRAYGLKFDETLNQTGERWQIGAARDLSNNIVMSHVKCGPYHDDNGTANQLGDATPADIYYYNRNLSEICAEVTANNFDMFISIHSNAATEGTSTNYPLFLYGGYDTPQAGTGTVTLERQTLSRKMCDLAWNYAYENPHAQWTAYKTSKNLRGDIDFYHSGSSGNLGVLKHAAPGYLVEGYFHTYQPARHRAMNWDVCYVEGNAYAKGVADYFGLTKEKTGIIYGVVRDQYEKFSDAAYSPNPTTADAYKPLNGVKVVLKKDGAQVAEYTTDNYYNGAFVFKGVQPGKYTIEFAHDQYLPIDPVEVEVKASANAYPIVNLVNKDWTPPAIVYENYPDVVVPGKLAADEYEFTQTYVDEPIAELEGKTVRRVIAKGNTLYILALDAEKKATIIVYDGVAKTVLANVSTEGTQGSVQAVGDIQLTADGALVATNVSLNHFDAGQVQTGETRGVNRIYVWENDENGIPTGAPKELGSSMLTGNFYRATVGHTMAFSGTLEEGKIIVPAMTTGSSLKYFFNVYTVVDGKIASYGFSNKNKTNFLNGVTIGNDYCFTTSPLDDTKFVATSSKYNPFEFVETIVADGEEAKMPEGFADGSFTTAFFKYNSHAYMLAADNAEGKNIGVKLVDVTNGFDKPVAIATINTSLPESADAAVAGSVVAKKDAEEKVTDAYFNLYVIREGKISRMTTEGVEVKGNEAPMAYDLTAEQVDEYSYKLNFKSTVDAKDAAVVLTPATEGEEAVRIELGAIKAGDNSVTVDDKDLTAGESYNWAIELTGKTSAVSGVVRSEKNSHAVRGGVVTMTDPNNAAFGRTIVAHGKVKGFDVYDAVGNKIANLIHAQHKNISSAFTNPSDPFRGSEYNGYAIFPCWGDKASGVIMVDVANLEAEPLSLFRNGTNDGTGNHKIDGANVGGGSAGACIIGDPENARLYSFGEDVEGKNGKGTTENALHCYEIGAYPWAVTKAPVVLPNNGYKSNLANGQAELVPYGNGFFAIQYRGAGNQNTSVPGFIYIDGTDHSIKFNSGTLKELNSAKDGLAITRDGKTLAVCMESGIAVYDVTWDGTTPSMTQRYVFGGANDRYVHLSFDYAGNLHVYRPSNGYYVYALAQESPVVTTPARAEFAVKVNSGVEDITIEGEDNNAPVEYFNINGVRVNGENLLPGIYIKRQGKKVEKILVK